MALPKRFVHEKTTVINVGGSAVPVTSFPQAIIEEFEMMDKMKFEAGELAFRLEVLALAIKAKTAEITSLVSDHYRKKDAAPSQDQPASK